jgi:Cellulase (glycosyl hydrolase family 5)
MNMGTVRADYGWPRVPFGTWRLIHANTVWSRLEPAAGQWQWDVLDRAVADAQARGVEPLLTLGYTPDWAARRKPGAPTPHEGQALTPPADLATWRRYVSTVAERYRGRVRWFELWNEPHFSETDKVDHGFSVNDMVALAREARSALRAVDAGNRLVSFSPPGAEHGIRRLELFFERGGGAHIDAIGFHFYTTPPSPEAVLPLARRLRAVADRHGLQALPIWNTEAGYQTEDPEHGIAAGRINRHGDRYLTQSEAAAFVPRTLLMALQGGIERYYYYGWALKGYQLAADRGRVPSAAGLAYATSHRWLLGMRFHGCRQPAPTVWRCVVERPADGQSAEVVWSLTDEETGVAPGDARFAETIYGETRPLGAGEQPTAGIAPLLLKRTAARWSLTP